MTAPTSKQMFVPSSHGGNVLEHRRRTGRDALDFSANADVLVYDLTAEIVKSIDYPFGLYPDPDYSELRRALADYEEVGPEKILLGSGSSELIFLAFHALKPKRVLMPAPIFSEYARACANLGIEFELLNLSADNDFQLTEADIDRAASLQVDMLVLCSPNNPTCAVYDNVEQLIRRVDCETVLLDATYREFLYGSDSYDAYATKALRSVHSGSSLIILDSFTKYFGCPGVRLGRVTADRDVTDLLRAHQPPWTVGRFEELVGLKLLERIDEFHAAKRALPTLREELKEALENLGHFIHVMSSDVNFLTARVKRPEEARRLRDTLADKGVLVRLCDDITGMPAGYLRMQVRSREDNHVLLDALSDIA